MKAWQKLILVLTTPLVVSLCLVVSGQVFGNTRLIAIAGLGLLFPCFLAFAFADRALLRLQQLRASNKFTTYLSGFDSTTREVFAFVAKLPLTAALVIRGFFLSLSFWIVSLFVSLCEGGVDSFLGAFTNNLLMSIVSLGISVFDATRGKTVDNPGWPTRLLSIFGFFQFAKGLYLLIAACLGPSALEGTKTLFTNPAWFLFPFERYQVLRIVTEDGGLILALMGFGLFQLIALFQSLEVLRRPTTPDNVDPKNFAAAMLILSFWVLPIPIYYVGSFIYFIVTTSK